MSYGTASHARAALSLWRRSPVGAIMSTHKTDIDETRRMLDKLDAVHDAGATVDREYNDRRIARERAELDDLRRELRDMRKRADDHERHDTT